MPVTAFRSPTVLRSAFVVLTLALTSACSSTPPTQCERSAYTPHDPAESINRGIFAFNRTLDDYAIAPVARGYRHLPGAVQGGVHNFVANFGEPKVFINDVLQGNARRSANTLGRFLINTTVGVVGLIDVSGRLGIERHSADFGQTFGVWNLAEGPIVELPLFGTANLRDATGRVLSFAVDPFGGNSDTVDTLKAVNTVGGIVDGRAEKLPLTDELRTRPDYYAAVRDVVALQRLNFVAEGKLGRELQAPWECGEGRADEPQ
ncbi:MAG TPA: VacJ family lipoprotein [Pseudomonas sp.]|nr:VacJ family lipoprotein [Pseudomonas sp.]